MDRADPLNARNQTPTRSDQPDGFGVHRPERPAAGDSSPTFNDAESPLSWLRTRRDRSGKPLISNAQFVAGERLRSDFERAMLARRTTTNWSLAGSGRGSNAAAELSDGAIAARQRYQNAITAVGPELASILQQVCCLAAGLEQAERVLNLPQRSGKAVLGLALTALARHYGITKDESRTGQRVSQWGMEGYRPAIPQAEREET